MHMHSLFLTKRIFEVLQDAVEECQGDICFNKYIFQSKKIPVNITMDVMAYHKAKKEKVNFSEVMMKALENYVEKKENVTTCDYCGKELIQGEIKWIFANNREHDKWSQGKNARCCKICKFDHDDINKLPELKESLTNNILMNKRRLVFAMEKYILKMCLAH